MAQDCLKKLRRERLEKAIDKLPKSQVHTTRRSTGSKRQLRQRPI